MNRQLKGIWITVGAIVAGVPTLYGFHQAWVAIDGPRPIWNWEFRVYAQDTAKQIEDIESGGIRNKYELYLLNRRAVQDDILSYSVQIKSYQDNHQIAPNILVKALEDKQRDLERIESALAEMEHEK